MLLQMVFGNSPEQISLVIFIPTLKPNALGLNVLCGHNTITILKFSTVSKGGSGHVGGPVVASSVIST